jgi:hypothetical protein
MQKVTVNIADGVTYEICAERGVTSPALTELHETSLNDHHQ